MKKIIFILLSMCIIINVQAQKTKTPQLGNTSIHNIIASMTLEEKAQLLVGTERLSLSQKVPGAAGSTYAIPRLGIPSITLTDGPAGVRIQPIRKGESKTYYCTGFPIGSLLSSTWNTALVKQVGQAMGNEAREYGCDVLLGPGMNIQRNPLCGRNFEYFSEDPILSGKIATAIIKGVQSEGVGCSAKHFVCNNQETLRTFDDARVSNRSLREIYLKNFEIAVKEGQPWTIMSSYNKVNGVFTQESYPLLYNLLRKEWKFNGIIVTDWTGHRNTTAQIHAGNDLLMAGMNIQVEDIVNAVKTGKLSITELDCNVERVLHLILKTPSFKKYPYSNNPDLKTHAKVSHQAAGEGIVLLKNTHKALPFNDSIKTIALFGISSYNFLAGGLGSGDVNKAYVINLEQGLKNAGYTIQPKISNLYNKYTAFEDEQFEEVNKLRGWYIGKLMLTEPEIDSTYIKLRAKESDIAVITIGRNAGEGTDRHNTPGDFLLTRNEINLIKNVTKAYHEIDKKVVVVINSGGIIETASWKNIPDAIIMAWQPGQEGGNAVADILKGSINPSGKLPATLPLNYLDIPSSNNFPYDYIGFDGDENSIQSQKQKNVGYTNYDENIWIGYRYFNTFHKNVSYPFGYGLSYTTFAYSNPIIKKSGNNYTVTIKITNTGSKPGKEVTELYISAPKTQIEKPTLELKTFNKTKLLQPKESETVIMTFNLSDMGSFNEKLNSWITDEGTYRILIGSSIQDIQSQLTLKINKPFIQKVSVKF